MLASQAVLKTSLSRVIITTARWWTASNALPYGTYTIQEVKAAEGYFLTDGEVRTFSIHEEGFVQPYTNAGDGAFINKVYRGDVQIVKHDLDSDTTTPQGEASLAGIKFAIKNTSKWPVQVDGVEYATGETVKIITTGEDGIAKTEGWTDAGGVKRGTLPYGTYTIEELPWDDAHPDYANASYMWTDKTVYDFKIEKDGVTVVQDYKVNTDMIYRNMVVRGGVSVEKRDIETKASCALGGATLEGTKFQIWLSEDVEQNPVYVNGKWYKKGEIIDLLAGDATYDVDGAHTPKRICHACK